MAKNYLETVLKRVEMGNINYKLIGTLKEHVFHLGILKQVPFQGLQGVISTKIQGFCTNLATIFERNEILTCVFLYMLRTPLDYAFINKSFRFRPFLRPETGRNWT